MSNINTSMLTMESLVKYFSKNKIKSFNYIDSGKPIVVKAMQDFSSSEIEELDDGKLYAKVRVCHTLLNRNGSYVSEDNMKKAMPTLKYAPLLGKIHQLDNGEWDFHKHDFHIDENGDTIYDESQIGTFTVDEPYLEYDKEMDKTYVIAKVAIPTEYTRAAQIIKDKGGTKVSCELCIYSCSYNAKLKYLELEDFIFMGCTCLGREKDGTEIGEGMLGSKLTLEDFSANDDILNKIVELQERLSKVESACFSIDEINSKEGGNNSKMSKFEELLNKYNKTLDDIDFEYESMSDEELEKKFAELFDDVDDESDIDAQSDSTTDSENDDASNEDETKSEDDITPLADVVDDQPSDEDEEVAVDTNDDVKKKVVNAQDETSMIKGYELSHSDIRYALYILLEDYEISDNEWYVIENVYDSHFVYSNWDGSKTFGQNYTKDGDNISFEGERFELFKELLTASEKAELETLRSNYASLVEFKETVEKNELHAKREAILSNDKYASVSETESFKNLVKTMDNYSLDDLEKEAKIIFADNYTVDESKVGHADVTVFNVTKKKGSNRYGTLFSAKK